MLPSFTKHELVSTFAHRSQTGFGQKTRENTGTSTPSATLASGSKDDTSSHMPLSAMQKTRTAVKPQNLVKFEDMGEVIEFVDILLAYLLYCDCRQ